VVESTMNRAAMEYRTMQAAVAYCEARKHHEKLPQLSTPMAPDNFLNKARHQFLIVEALAR
jgi:hypothetical protein